VKLLDPTALRRAAHRLMADATHPGVEPVRIGDLVSPLRYDVLVRAQLFEMFAAEPDVLAGPPEDLVRRAAAMPYRVWFELVAVARFKPHLLLDPGALDQAFAVRVAGAASLFRAVERDGFDERRPVLLRRSDHRTRSQPGKPVRPGLQIADGCHRLSLLMCLGWKELPARFYRVDSRPLTHLPDNTARLLGPLGLGIADYAAFLSLRYAEAEHHQLNHLVRYVANRRPELLGELLGVIAADAPLLRGVDDDPMVDHPPTTQS